jgi:hypothetical protein
MAESQSSLTTTSGSVWTREQDKEFENALNVYDQEGPNRWEQIAAVVTGKDAAEVKRHYEVLQEDINLIDAGRVALPNYSLSSLSEEGPASDSPGVKKGASFAASGPGANANSNGVAALGGKGMSSKSADQERRKGIPWSEEEHRWVVHRSMDRPVTTFSGAPLYFPELKSFGFLQTFGMVVDSIGCVRVVWEDH